MDIKDSFEIFHIFTLSVVNTKITILLIVILDDSIISVLTLAQCNEHLMRLLDLIYIRTTS